MSGPASSGARRLWGHLRGVRTGNEGPARRISRRRVRRRGGDVGPRDRNEGRRRRRGRRGRRLGPAIRLRRRSGGWRAGGGRSFLRRLERDKDLPVGNVAERRGFPLERGARREGRLLSRRQLVFRELRERRRERLAV